MIRNKLKLVTKILAIIIICLISFVGIYVQKYNKMENVVKDYNLSKDLYGYRQIILEVSEEEESSEEESEDNADEENDEGESVEEDNKTTENYELAKSIIENRLKEMNNLSAYEELSDINTEDYNISLDKQTGKIYIQIPENNSTDYVVSNIYDTADFQITDSEDGTVLLDNSHIKNVDVVYSTTTSGTIVYLEIEFTKEGAEILEDISTNKYATLSDDSDEDTTTESEETEESEETTDSEETETESEEDTETSENEDSEETASDSEEESEEEEETQSQVTLTLSGAEVTTTSFDEPMTTGIIDLSMNSATSDTEELESYYESAETIAILLNNGKLPLSYEVTENQYVESDITEETIKNVMIVFLVVFAILLVYMIISKKIKGLLAAISFIGFAAIYSLLIRYTNVLISLESLVGGLIILFINYIFVLKMLKLDEKNQKQYNKGYIQELVKLIPIFAISIIFTFVNWTMLNSFGMIMFWGILLIGIYNILITKNVIN